MHVNWRNIAILVGIILLWAGAMGLLHPPIILNLITSFTLGWILASVFPPVTMRY